MIASSALAGTALASESSPYPNPTWDYETDVVIVGFGGAGAAAAITAAQEELGSCIVLEAAPAEYAGGNTSVAGQWLYSPDPDDPAAHLKALRGEYDVDDEVLEALGQALVENISWLEALGTTYSGSTNPEYAEIGHYGNGRAGSIDGGPDHRAIWKLLTATCDSLGVEVIYDARVVALVRDPQTNEPLGAIAEHDGSTIAVKAHKAVILCCGGFEGNPRMIRQYYPAGMPRVCMFGSPYNRGDGFDLVKPFGAQTWHENNFFTHRLARVISYKTDDTCLLNDYIAPNKFSTDMFGSKDFIQVGADGKRYMYEEVLCTNRHGKLYQNGTYAFAWFPEPCYVIFGQQAFESTPRFGSPDDENGWIMVHRPDLYTSLVEEVARGNIVTADSAAELAKLIGLPPTSLEETIERYNVYCEQNIDPDFGRGQRYDVTDYAAQAAIEPFDLVPLKAPFYAFEIRPGLLHTLGGARRNGSCQIIGSDGTPVPRLFGAGEFGSAHAWLHTNGAAIGEALGTGRAAMRNACALEPRE